VHILFEGLIYHLVYNLERHRLFNIRLRHWLILFCLILPATLWLKSWGTNRLAAMLVTLGAASALVATWWAGRQQFVRFEEYSALASEGIDQGTDHHWDEERPPSTSNSRLCATGHFEVSGMRRYFVETPANYTTFETGEHCVMTQVSSTRFLLLGKSPKEEVGWWYTFFQPDMIRSVASGWLFFGLHPRPALCLDIGRSDDAEDESLHLSFDDEATRALILADLRAETGLV
jgi:hypothetical protein